MKRLLLILALYGICALRCEAQFLGYVSMQTIAPAQVFTAQAANGTTGIFTNLGQSAHFLTYCSTGFLGTISLESSPDGTFATPVTLATASYLITGDTTCHVLQAGGYFQAVRARVSNYVGGSVNAWYTGVSSPVTFAPTAIGSTGPTAPIACDKTVFADINQSTNQQLIAGSAGTTIYVCQATFSFSAATTTGGVSLGRGAASDCTTPVALWAFSATSTTPQTLTMGGPLGSFVRTRTGGDALCVTTGAITAAVRVAVSYAQF